MSERPSVTYDQGQFNRFPNGLDLKGIFVPKKRKNTGNNYERLCFQKMMEQFPGEFFLGPNLIDGLFNFSQEYGSRPDLMSFEVDNGVWTLKRLFEIGLTGGENGKKLAGFSLLLEILRENANPLLEAISKIPPELVAIPSQITIPDDDQMTVIFICPQYKNPRQRESTEGINVQYVGVRRKKQRK